MSILIGTHLLELNNLRNIKQKCTGKEQKFSWSKLFETAISDLIIYFRLLII